MNNQMNIGDIVRFKLDRSVCGIVIHIRGGHRKRFYVQWFDEYELYDYMEDELELIS